MYYSLAKKGGPVRKLLGEVKGLYDLAVDSTYIYFTSFNGPMRMPKAGGQPTLLEKAVVQASAVVAEGGDVYLATQSGVLKLPGGAGPPVVLSNDPCPTSPTLDVQGGNVYYATSPVFGTLLLRRVSVMGGQSTTVAVMDPGCTSMASLSVDGSCAFYSAYQGDNLACMGLWKAAR